MLAMYWFLHPYAGGGVGEKIKISGDGRRKKLQYVGGCQQIFPFRPPSHQDLKWNSPNGT